MWGQQYGKNTVVYTNSYDSYRGETLVCNFGSQINKGNYVIPFRFQLPAMMTGSFFISRFCHIKYLLRAVLVNGNS